MAGKALSLRAHMRAPRARAERGASMLVSWQQRRSVARTRGPDCADAGAPRWCGQLRAALYPAPLRVVVAPEATSPPAATLQGLQIVSFSSTQYSVSERKPKHIYFMSELQNCMPSNNTE